MDESRICKEGENGVVPDMQRCAVEEPGHGFARGRLEDVWSRICKGSEGNREARRGINKLCLDRRQAHRQATRQLLQKSLNASINRPSGWSRVTGQHVLPSVRPDIG